MPTLPNDSDKDSILVEACKKELPYTTHAFEKLIRKYEPTVLNTCRFLLNDLHDSEETCQDVFLRVFHHIKKFNQNSTFRTWLYRIVRNCCYTRMKRQEKQLIFRKDILFDVESFADKQESDNPMSVKMEEALSRLSSEDREIITLRFIAELSIKEIAETMQIQLSAAKMRLYRAMERLKEEYKQFKT